MFRHNSLYHAYITARAKDGPTLERGVIAHAVSADLINWEVREPVTKPGEFGHLEVPQLQQIGDRWYLFFCTEAKMFSEKRRALPGIVPETGTHYFIGDDPFGPFELAGDEFLIGDEVGSQYTSKVIQDPTGEWVLLSSYAWSKDGFNGKISDPIKLNVGEYGRLSILHSN